MPSAVRRATSSMISRASCEAVMSRKTSSSAPCASYASAASTGSPASRRSTKRTPLTTRPSLTSRHGMTRLANIYCNGVREAATLRGWPDPGATRLPSSPALTPGIREAAPPPPVHGDDHPCRPSPADLAEELRIQRGSRPHDGPARAGLERQPDRLEIAQAAAHLHGDWGDRRHDLGDERGLARLAGERAVEIHDVEPPCAEPRPGHGRRDRIPGKDGLLVASALTEPHAAPVA